MENVVLIIHLLLALSLVGVVLMQRSEGGGLGMGGGGRAGGVMSGRAAATALGKVTWILAICFICTSITLTVLGASGGGSALDRLGGDASAPAGEAPANPLGDGTDLLPPSPTEGDAPLVPQITE
ncbi:MAG: preprotein translocase subunit SecG [Pseudomonadota bacterium]